MVERQTGMRELRTAVVAIKTSSTINPCRPPGKLCGATAVINISVFKPVLKCIYVEHDDLNDH